MVEPTCRPPGAFTAIRDGLVEATDRTLAQAKESKMYSGQPTAAPPPNPPSLNSTTQDLLGALNRIAGLACDIRGKLFAPEQVPVGEAEKQPYTAITCTVDECKVAAIGIEKELTSINDRL